MDNFVAVAAIGFVGTIVSAIVLYTNRRRNGAAAPAGAMQRAIDPEHAKSGDLAAAFWMQQFKLIYDTLNLHASKMEGLGVKIDALTSETRYGFGSSATLLQDILRELRHNNGRRERGL